MDSSDRYVYVSNEAGRTLSVISVRRDVVVATIPVGERPRGVRMGPGGRRVYVALSGSPRCPPTMSDAACDALKSDRSKDGIAEVDPLTQRVLRTLPGGVDPEQFDIAPNGQRLYVADEGSGYAAVVDVARAALLDSIRVGKEPEGVRIAPDGKTVLVTSEAEHVVVQLDASTGQQLHRTNVGMRPRDVLFTADGTAYFASAEVGGTISRVNARTGTVAWTLKLPAGSKPMGLALAPDETRLYVTTGRHGTVEVVDLSTHAIVGSVKVGPRPWGIGLIPDGHRLYVANGPSNDVSVINTATLHVDKTIAVGTLPWGIAVEK